ncbi:MAG: AAA family ATPase [Acidaminococcaceae bacterium]|nr:AAA family ATPase [Acidaminococcaceae bacterium]
MNYLTINEAAEKWNVTPRRIQQLCKEGKIDGAIKEGRSWKIPEDAVILLRNAKRRVQKEGAPPYDFFIRETAAPQYAADRANGLYAAPAVDSAHLLPLPVGISSYTEAVTRYFYIDKTLLIRDFLDTLPKVSLFTRPRRFGKTLNMDMLRVFFEKSETDTSVYFKGKAIWSCGEYYRSFQGKYPVIYLSFKDVKYSSWKNARKDIADNIAAEYARHPELADSKNCNALEKGYYKKMLAGKLDEVELARSLSVLSSMLHKQHGTGTVIIIDEYDTPIQQGYASGYYEDVIAFIRNLFSGAFKDNPNLAYGFMTGILRVARESIFSGLNNLKVNTIMDDRFSQYFGFTRQEVARMLAYYKGEEKLEEVCAWYDGYRFGNSEIFNPWSVINYIDDMFYPKAFWQSTGSNEIIGEIISNAAPDVTENLRKLLQGETITAYVDTSVIYPEVKTNPSSIYSFLLMAGYLKNAEIIPQNDGNFLCRVQIPNKEISFVYAKEIIARMNRSETESTASSIQQAIYEKDTRKLKNCIENFLMQTISFYDSSSEAFYQGLMLGLCSILNNRYSVRSNRESGYGRFDIQLTPMNKNLPGFLFELKSSKNNADDLEKIAADALTQIKAKRYDVEMKSADIREIINAGLAFRGKEVSIKSE